MRLCASIASCSGLNTDGGAWFKSECARCFSFGMTCSKRLATVFPAEQSLPKVFCRRYRSSGIVEVFIISPSIQLVCITPVNTVWLRCWISRRSLRKRNNNENE